ncbi:hypothetical protein KM043_002248 [Ampulex compressa]|nr:hypothetical protein KM043_002248 [Ampulex compressa]
MDFSGTRPQLFHYRRLARSRKHEGRWKKEADTLAAKSGGSSDRSGGGTRKPSRKEDRLASCGPKFPGAMKAVNRPINLKVLTWRVLEKPWKSALGRLRARRWNGTGGQGGALESI